MAEVRAFRGFRYDLGRAGALSDLVAPPYDVVDAALQKDLYDRSPYNAIRVELTQDEPGDNENANKYTRAAGTLHDWQNKYVLNQDTARNLYVVEQTFTVEDRAFTRRGFLARVRLEHFGEGKIYPHEQTMSGPKADRLKLYQATNMNISPVFGLYPDEANEVYSHIEPLLINRLPTEATDHLGVTSKMWTITDDKIHSVICGQMANRAVFIADGHHRYETGLKYRDELAGRGVTIDADHPANFILMMLVSMGDPGLIILPTHRLVSGYPGLTSKTLTEKLQNHFDVKTHASALEAWEDIEMDGSQNLLGFHTAADNQWVTARLNKSAAVTMKELAADHSDDWRELGVAVLHELVLKHLLGGEPKVTYVHLLKEVTDAIAAKSCDLACLVPPAEMIHVEAIAGNLEKMPPKSTYFYPKILTGLVFNSLKVN